jgi:uncharacterized protein (DUF433 family)
MERVHPKFSRITINPEICAGKPCIRGIRFPLTTLFGYLAGGVSIETLLIDFPFLEREDIWESFAYAASAMDEQILPFQSARA